MVDAFAAVQAVFYTISWQWMVAFYVVFTKLGYIKTPHICWTCMAWLCQVQEQKLSYQLCTKILHLCIVTYYNLFSYHNLDNALLNIYNVCATEQWTWVHTANIIIYYPCRCM